MASAGDYYCFTVAAIDSWSLKLAVERAWEICFALYDLQRLRHKSNYVVLLIINRIVHELFSRWIDFAISFRWKVGIFGLYLAFYFVIESRKVVRRSWLRNVLTEHKYSWLLHGLNLYAHLRRQDRRWAHFSNRLEPASRGVQASHRKFWHYFFGPGFASGPPSSLSFLFWPNEGLCDDILADIGHSKVDKGEDLSIISLV